MSTLRHQDEGPSGGGREVLVVDNERKFQMAGAVQYLEGEGRPQVPP